MPARALFVRNFTELQKRLSFLACLNWHSLQDLWGYEVMRSCLSLWSHHQARSLCTLAVLVKVIQSLGPQHLWYVWNSKMVANAGCQGLLILVTSSVFNRRFEESYWKQVCRFLLVFNVLNCIFPIYPMKTHGMQCFLMFASEAFHGHCLERSGPSRPSTGGWYKKPWLCDDVGSLQQNVVWYSATHMLYIDIHTIKLFYQIIQWHSMMIDELCMM